ncbi:hypothetical protein ABID62_007803 [Bradyrhizobium sp. S3.9.1]
MFGCIWTLEERIIEPNDVRVVVVCCKVVAGLRTGATPGQNDRPELGREPGNPFGTHWRIRGYDRYRMAR